MDRQMFRKGGAAFPDLTGPGGGKPDGKITQADILMGRGVEFKQEGGIAGMVPPMIPPAPAMMPNAEMVPPAEAAAMGEATMDTGMLQSALAQVSDNLAEFDEVEDFEQVMNVMRGDNATLDDRYDELAEIVGRDDAQKTPESVLALVQPVMMMASVDQGIGGLAQQEMMEPVQGAMAQGIMSTVEPPQPTGGMGGPPPVNFKDGGLVRRGDNQPVQKFFQKKTVQLFWNLTPH